jgi:hypothetical protein
MRCFVHSDTDWSGAQQPIVQYGQRIPGELLGESLVIRELPIT